MDKSMQFMPDDGMTVEFTLIMLSGTDKKGKQIYHEIQIGGRISSKYIAALPDFKEFAIKCADGETVEVDNFAYELKGKDWHTRKATRDEINQIVQDDDFPYNFDSSILHPINHDGPDQFKVVTQPTEKTIFLTLL